jgi:hypothetical protein
MKTNIRNRFMIGILLIGGALCSFTGVSLADQTVEIKTQSQMKGQLYSLEKMSSFVSVGDKVYVTLTKEAKMMPGDRMEIYEPVKSGKMDENGDSILVHVGRLKVISSSEGQKLGIVEFAVHEISTESYVDFTTPEDIDIAGLVDYLKSLLEGHLKNPATSNLKVAFADVTNNSGSITKMDEEIYKKLSTSFCAKLQFSCISRGTIHTLMMEYGLSTTANPGKYFLLKTGTQLKADVLITASASPAEQGKVTVTIRAYSTLDGTQDPDGTVMVKGIKFINDPSEGGVVVNNTNKRQGILKVVLNKSEKLNGKRVDNFFVESLEGRVPEKFSDLIKDILLNVKMELDYRPLEQKGKSGEYYFDMVSSGTHMLTVSVFPFIPGKPGVVTGKKISKTVSLDIPSDVGTEVEVDVKTHGKQVIIAVDSNGLEEQPLAPMAIP